MDVSADVSRDASDAAYEQPVPGGGEPPAQYAEAEDVPQYARARGRGDEDLYAQVPRRPKGAPALEE